MKCTVCQHNQIKDIDRALLTGATVTSLSQKYGFSTSALHRHQEHLVQKMALAQKRFHDSLRQGLFCKLNLVVELVLGVVRGAKVGEDFKLFLQASREVSRIISLMLKMDVQLEPEMIYCLMASPQWDLQDSLLPNAFQALSDTRQTLSVNLFAPCSDSASELIPEPAPSSPVETQNSELETLYPTVALTDQSPDLLQSVNLNLDQQPAPQTKSENREPKNEKRPLKKRAKSAKLPRQPAPLKIDDKEYHADMVAEKNCAKYSTRAVYPNVPPVHSCSGPAATAPLETRNSKLGTLFQRFFWKWEKSGKLPGKTTFIEDIK